MSYAICGAMDINGARLTAKDLELQQSQDLASSATTRREAREHVEREMIEQALERNQLFMN